METLIIKSSATTTNTDGANNKPWYDRAADAVVDSIMRTQMRRDEIKRIEADIKPLKEARMQAEARARAIAWARSQGYDVKYED